MIDIKSPEGKLWTCYADPPGEHCYENKTLKTENDYTSESLLKFRAMCIRVIQVVSHENYHSDSPLTPLTYTLAPLQNKIKSDLDCQNALTRGEFKIKL